jgi:long-chain fatty acid transport protein
LKKLALVVTAILSASSAFGVGSGGYTNQVPHARAMGRANSVAASIDDSSAISFNAARLTAIKSLDLSVGGTFQDLATDYEDPSGVNDSSVGDGSFSPNFHFASRLPWEKWVAGIGVNIPYGLTTEWDKNSPLRYIATKSELAIVSISPTVAFSVTDKFSVGVGLDYYSVSKAKFDRQVNVTALNFALGGAGIPEADGSQRLDADGNDMGANVGVAYTVNEHHMVGLSYRTGANIDVEGSVKIDGLSNESAAVFGGTTYETMAKSTILVPAELQMGYAFRPSERLTLELDTQWNRWGRYRDQNIRFSETDQNRLDVLNSDNPTQKNWTNAWSAGLGAEFKICEGLTGRAGYGFLDSPVPGSSFEASTPDSDMHLISLGVGYAYKAWALDLGGQYFVLNERGIENNVGATSGSSGNGTYDSDALFVAFNVSYRR